MKVQRHEDGVVNSETGAGCYLFPREIKAVKPELLWEG